MTISREKSILTRYVLNTLRILKAKNPGDTYYDEYLKHFAREGEEFYDQYHFAIERVMDFAPKRILEVGVRTGLSICNMLSAYTDYSGIEKVVLVDLWNDGFTSPSIVQMNLKAMGIPQDLFNKIELHTADSHEYLPKLIDQSIFVVSPATLFDYILVDGDHSKEGAAKDLEDAAQLIETGGVIVFDDITDRGCNLQDVWDDFKEINYKEFVFHEDYNGKGVGWAIKK